MGKKAKKKQPDTRGFSTTSVLPPRPPPTTTPTPSTSTSTSTDLPIENKTGTTTETETDTKASTSELWHATKTTGFDECDRLFMNEKEDNSEADGVKMTSKQSLFQQRVSSEVIHIKKMNAVDDHTGNIYRGQLFPPVPVEADVMAIVPTPSLLQRLISHAQLVSNSEDCYPLSYNIPSWNYERAMRVMHALGGARFSVDSSCKALLATRGYDERAAVEHALLNFPPDQVPNGWCEAPAQSTRVVPEGCDDVASVSSAEQDLLLENLALHKSKEKDYFEAVQRAKQLAITIQQENDARLLCSNTQKVTDLETDPVTIAEYYKSLDSKCGTLKNAKGYLDLREKGLVDGRMRELRMEMAELRSIVDFRLLRGENNSAKNVNDIEVAATIAKETEVGVETIDHMETNSEEGLLSLFESDEEDLGCKNSSEKTVAEPIFHYTTSKSHTAPQKILGQMVTDFRTFTNVGEQVANRWKECVTMGPLLSSTAKQLALPKGTVFNVTPSNFSTNKESARELTCLRLLYEIFPGAGQRGKVSQKLNPEALKQWNLWIVRDASEREKALWEEAEKRVQAVEDSLVGRSALKSQSPGQNEALEDKVKSSHNHRIALTLAQLQNEMSTREKRGVLQLEHIRDELPVVKESRYVANLIARNDISIICGETGSGKSTQVPQIIIRDTDLTDATEGNEVINIIVTEPRRVAAVSVSQRVGEEMGDTGSLQDALCGYTVRLDSRVGPRCVVEYVTVGVLLRRIQTSNGACLASYSHVVVDEVHERSVDSDLLLMMLKEYRDQALLKHNKINARALNLTGNRNGAFPRVVMMSATADVEAIASYWGVNKDNCSSGDGVSCSELAVAHIPGRTFPVAVSYLEEAILESGFVAEPGLYDGRRSRPEEYLPTNDSGSHINFAESFEDETLGSEDDVKEVAMLNDAFKNLDLCRINYGLLHQVIKYELLRTDGDTTGAILVFMPGLEEIRQISQMIESDNSLRHLCDTLPMHSSLSFQDLQRAFRRAGPGKRKLVISTNICETGVTIEDVDLVIDTGFVKSIEWNQVTEISRLRMHHCSIAEATQRRGRAGRVRPGRCVHLFPRYFVESCSSGDDGKLENTRMKRRPDPEIKRAPLTSPILSLIDQGFKPSLLLTAPGNVLSTSKLENATRTLVDLGAIILSESSQLTSSEGNGDGNGNQDILSEHYRTTPLGKCLALLPCSPSSGIILIAARKLSCLEAAAVFVASLDCKSVFMKCDNSTAFFRQKFGKKAESDAAAIVNVYSEWHRAESKYRWCQSNSISMPAMSHLVKVVKDLLRVVGCSDTKLQSQSDSKQKSYKQCTTCLSNIGMHTCVTGSGTIECLHAAITSGVGKNVSFCSSPAADGKPATYLSGNKSTTHCRIHISSLATNPGDWIVYYSQMKNQSGRQSLLNVSSINLFTALLFVPWVKFYIGDGTIIIGRGIGIKCKPQTIVALRRLKAKWEKSLVMHGALGDEGTQVSLEEKECINLIINLISSKML